MKDKVYVGLLVFIIRTPVGYFLNNYLARERLTVEYLEIKPNTKKHSINKSLLADIIVNTKQYYHSNSSIRLESIPHTISSELVELLKNNIESRKINTLAYIRKIDKQKKEIEKDITNREKPQMVRHRLSL